MGPLLIGGGATVGRILTIHKMCVVGYGVLRLSTSRTRVPLDFGTGVGDSRTRTLVEISGTLKAVGDHDHAAEVFGSHPKTAFTEWGANA
jgi:hypothetical protein